VKLTLRIFSLIAVLALLVFSVACVSGERITVGDIVSAPAKNEGKSVTVSGEYRGWEAGHGSPPVTRSDWVLKDATGAIYVTGRAPSGFNPAGDVGKKVTVTGVVRVKNSQAYIEAESIK
jgi:hypothetical protein